MFSLLSNFNQQTKLEMTDFSSGHFHEICFSLNVIGFDLSNHDLISLSTAQTVFHTTAENSKLT